MDIAQGQTELEKVDTEIAVKEEKFNESISALVKKRDALRTSYATALRHALKSVENGRPRRVRGTAPIIEEDRILDVLRKAQIELSAKDIRERVGLSSDVTANALSVKMAAMIESGRVVKVGERRATKYRVA